MRLNLVWYEKEKDVSFGCSARPVRCEAEPIFIRSASIGVLIVCNDYFRSRGERLGFDRVPLSFVSVTSFSKFFSATHKIQSLGSSLVPITNEDNSLFFQRIKRAVLVVK